MFVYLFKRKSMDRGRGRGRGRLSTEQRVPHEAEFQEPYDLSHKQKPNRLSHLGAPPIFLNIPTYTVLQSQIFPPLPNWVCSDHLCTFPNALLPPNFKVPFMVIQLSPCLQRVYVSHCCLYIPKRWQDTWTHPSSLLSEAVGSFPHIS